MNTRLRVLVLLVVALAGCRAARIGEALTFVVMGDNRGGDDSGEQPAAFHELVGEVAALKPDLVWNTGDMIYGRSRDQELVRMQWARYREALAPLRMPIHHVPGNHDLWDETSSRLYQELWGETHYVVDRGPVRFIALDTETEPGRVGRSQMEWLRGVLEKAGGRLVVVILHQPLFPVASHVETSLDAYPAERDALHRLFVQHRVAAVFAGHEHLYRHEKRDGIDYYTTGGGGADLHVPPERGGFHHFLVVRATGGKLQVELHKTGDTRRIPAAARRVRPGELLESWESGLLWSTWDYTVSAERTTARVREGQGALQLNLHLAFCGWPVLSTSPGWSESGPPAAWSIDILVPADAPAGLAVTPGAEGRDPHDAPSVRLQPGWNHVRTAAVTNWLPEAERVRLRSAQWTFTSPDPRWHGDLLVDGFRSEPAGGAVGPLLLEGWERPLVWNMWNEASEGRFVTEGVTEGQRAFRFEYNRAECRDPMLVGKAGPPLDLTDVAALEFSVEAPAQPPSISLIVRSGEEEYAAPASLLQAGRNRVKVLLDGDWLPAEVRRRVEQLAWRIESSDAPSCGELVFDELRASMAPSMP